MITNVRYVQGLLAAALLCVGMGMPALAKDATVTDSGTVDKHSAAKPPSSKPSYSPYAGRNFPTRPFFGDTHLHTAMSFDAGMFGAKLGPVEGAGKMPETMQYLPGSPGYRSAWQVTINAAEQGGSHMIRTDLLSSHR